MQKLDILWQNRPFHAKIVRNRKMFLEFIFMDQMVYKFAQG